MHSSWYKLVCIRTWLGRDESRPGSPTKRQSPLYDLCIFSNCRNVDVLSTKLTKISMTKFSYNPTMIIGKQHFCGSFKCASIPMNL